jgi:hypothetical protein
MQAANAAPSSVHSNVAPGVLLLTTNTALVLVVTPDGPETMLGATGTTDPSELTLQVHVAGERSWLPLASRAATVNVCEPTLSPLSDTGEDEHG